MLPNAYFLAKIGADTAENEQHFAEILLKTGTDGANHRRGCDRHAPLRAARAQRAAGCFFFLTWLNLRVPSGSVFHFRHLSLPLGETLILSWRMRQEHQVKEVKKTVFCN